MVITFIRRLITPLITTPEPPSSVYIERILEDLGRRIQGAGTRTPRTEYLSDRRGQLLVLGGSWDLVSKVISTLIGVISSYQK